MDPGTCGPRAHEASASDAPSSWCSHPAYARYWRHYREAAAWVRIHRRAYRKAVRCCFGSPWYFAPGIQHHSACPGEPWYPPLRDRRTAGEEQAPWPEEEEKEEEEEEETETESDGEVECDLSHMEITEELRQYFATTERHRAERRRQQQLDAARLDDYVNADHDLYFCPRSVQPPAERPGERRQAEMKLLYGEAAAKIQAMEAAVQLSFDRRCDRKLPKYWPVIPLKF